LHNFSCFAVWTCARCVAIEQTRVGEHTELLSEDSDAEAVADADANADADAEEEDKDKDVDVDGN
jgi:hypothetical protein